MHDSLQKTPRQERRFLARLWPALLVCFALSFTFVIFGPVDLIVHNGAYMPFSVSDVAGWLLLAALLITGLLALPLALLRGKAHGRALSLAVGLLLAGYAQGTFLNQHVGQLTGDAVDWAQHAGHALWNGLIWCALVLVPLILYRFAKRIWKRAVPLLAGLLIGMQGVALGSALWTTPLTHAAGAQYLSYDGCYEVSTKKNIIVFTLDRLDNMYIENLLAEDPYYLDGMTGFTYYPNHIAQYNRTYPAIASMLTGRLSFYEAPAKQYFQEAWPASPLLNGLRDQGYTTKLFITKGYAYTDAAVFDGLVANTASNDMVPMVPEILKRMARLTAYRYMPFALKRNFWLASSDFKALAKVEHGSPVYEDDDFVFMEGLVEHGITTQSETNNFAFYHMRGCHDPGNIDENADWVPEYTISLGRQLKGCLTIVDTYLEWLRKHGLYDDATIIITGDHGFSDNLFRLEDSVKTALFYKPSGSADESLQISDAPVSHANFIPTVLAEAGVDISNIGRAYTDISEEEVNPRIYYNQWRGKELEVFEVRGDPSFFDNWEKIEEIPIRYDHG